MRNFSLTKFLEEWGILFKKIIAWHTEIYILYMSISLWEIPFLYFVKLPLRLWIFSGLRGSFISLRIRLVRKYQWQIYM